MSVDAEQKCPECGGVIPKESAHCPACMLDRAMGEDDSMGETTSMGDAVSVMESAGDSIGPYKLLEKVG